MQLDTYEINLEETLFPFLQKLSFGFHHQLLGYCCPWVSSKTPSIAFLADICLGKNVVKLDVTTYFVPNSHLSNETSIVDEVLGVGIDWKKYGDRWH